MTLSCSRYDHSLLEAEEEGCEARRLTQRACHSTLTLGEQQRLLAELDKAGDTGVQVSREEEVMTDEEDDDEDE